MKIRTHYDNLKVSQDAPIEVIQAAYRSLAKKYHPDLNDNNDAKRIMQLINTSYEVLSDPVKRQEHDAWIARENWANFKSRSANNDGINNNPTSQPNQKAENKNTHIKLKSVFFDVLHFMSWVFRKLSLLAVIAVFAAIFYTILGKDHAYQGVKHNQAPQESHLADSMNEHCAAPVDSFDDGSPLPSSPAIHSIRAHKKGLSSLTLDNTQTSQNFVVKVSYKHNSSSKDFVWEAFIPAGRKLMISGVPSGDYVVKTKDVKSGCAQVSEPINFYERNVLGGIEYSENSLTFYQVVNGNTDFKSIPSAQF